MTQEVQTEVTGILPGLQPARSKIIMWVIYVSLTLLAADLIYRTAFGISYENRQDCILYNVLPRAVFLFYEYFIELFLIVTAGVFGAVLLEKYFKRYKRFYPGNTITAFLYASVIPVCSCSAIPMMETMQDKMRFRTILTFIVAAPLLNPYIIALSFSVLGWEYALLRIMFAFLLAGSAGIILERFVMRFSGKYRDCKPGPDCGFIRKDIYYNTYLIMRKIFPYLLLAGLIGLAVEFYDPSKVLNNHFVGSEWWGVLIAVGTGMPVYFCNGADVVFLQPLMQYAGLGMGTALAFSLTSTAICISSFVMLWKFMGRKATILLSIYIVFFTIASGIFINWIQIRI